MPGLFDQTVYTPLAARLRPQHLSEVVGQEHLLSAGAPLEQMVQTKKPQSCILWGPAGCGKTTIATLLAQELGLFFEQLSATASGVADIRKVFSEAQNRRHLGQGTLLFIDEIHRFTRSQQDVFLPYVEDGSVILIGATTENPSFELNSALLSRCKVFVLNPHTKASLDILRQRAEKLMGKKLPIDEQGYELLQGMADGDGRYFINLMETVFNCTLPSPIPLDKLVHLLQKKMPVYDKDKEAHYNLISALHKSLRGSDPDAALYWLARMITGGEDKIYILRRLTRFAAEDIGLADPHALSLAISSWESYKRLGSPEGDLSIAMLVVYLATAPKSISVYKAWGQVLKTAQETASLMPPKTILNAPTRLMKDLGYGQDYQYDPETKDGFSGQNYFPDGMARPHFYTPIERGFEREIKKRLDYWERLRKEKNA